MREKINYNKKLILLENKNTNGTFLGYLLPFGSEKDEFIFRNRSTRIWGKLDSYKIFNPTKTEELKLENVVLK